MKKIQQKDTLVCNPDASQDEYYDTALDVTGDSMSIQMGRPITEPFISDEVRIPTEKVGCIFVTRLLQQYLDEYPLVSDKQAF